MWGDMCYSTSIILCVFVFFLFVISCLGIGCLSYFVPFVFHHFSKNKTGRNQNLSHQKIDIYFNQTTLRSNLYLCSFLFVFVVFLFLFFKSGRKPKRRTWSLFFNMLHTDMRFGISGSFFILRTVMETRIKTNSGFVHTNPKIPKKTYKISRPTSRRFSCQVYYL